jgi:hypothetical protein
LDSAQAAKTLAQSSFTLTAVIMTVLLVVIGLKLVGDALSGFSG